MLCSARAQHLVAPIFYEGNFTGIVNHADQRIVQQEYFVAAATPWDLLPCTFFSDYNS
jgi:hypothetical protein